MSELAALIGRHVGLALDGTQLSTYAETAQSRIMRWLETDPSWADLYSVTGELLVGQVQQSDDGVDDAVKLVSEVRHAEPSPT